MDANEQCTTQQANRESGETRRNHARILEHAGKIGFWWQSPRKVAQRLSVPDSSFRYCCQQYERRCQQSNFPQPFFEFCESTPGLEFLHRLLVALHLVFVEANDSGLRSIGWFLELSGLDEFLPASYGAQQNFAAQLETLLAEFSEQEEQRLAAQMPPRQITVCEDETFHPQICLVAIEPVSNFLLLEQYAPKRDAETWNACLDERLASWSVTVCQVTSDQASALISHTEQHLGAHHSPDLFHVQHDTVKATSLALAGQTRRAHEATTAATQQTEQQQQELAACQQQCPQSSCLGELAYGRDQALATEAEARQRLTACQQRQQQATEARQATSHDYHPIDLETGQPVDADEVGRRLNGHFDQLDRIADEAELSSRSKEKLAKARRVLASMQSTILFFWTTVSQRLASWQLPVATAEWLREQLIPSLYLASVAGKAKTAAERQRLRERADEILARARSPDGVWRTLTESEQQDMEAKAGECAALFQRSSSCVEGHNGQLSLRHHGLHRLTVRKLGAIRVLHNYLIERRDGTTAAERFFGQPPQSLVPWLLARLPLPARPRRRHNAK
jgi:hypothetical protein